jgi:hypothetical protein
VRELRNTIVQIALAISRHPQEPPAAPDVIDEGLRGLRSCAREKVMDDFQRRYLEHVLPSPAATTRCRRAPGIARRYSQPVTKARRAKRKPDLA